MKLEASGIEFRTKLFTKREVARMAAKRKAKAQKLDRRQSPVFDPVAEASDESFPASDAPAWPSNEPGAAKAKRKKKRARSS